MHDRNPVSAEQLIGGTLCTPHHRRKGGRRRHERGGETSHLVHTFLLGAAAGLYLSAQAKSFRVE